LTKRQTFDRKYVFTELDRLSAGIVVPTQFFIIGGLALISHVLKEATKDIDVVVRRQDSCALIASLASIDYRILEDCSVYRPYGKMEILRSMENNDGFRLDIFYRTICNRLIFSDNMASRAIKFYSKEKMTLSIASKEDIFLFKGMTEREADLDDMRLLARSGLDWQVIKTECVHQSSISGRLWEDALLQNLIVLRKRHEIRSPIEKELRKIAEEKLSDDFIVKSIVDGFTTTKNISQAKNVPYHFVRECVRAMEKRGLLQLDKKHRPHKLLLTKS
jgi:hypothetical protein